MSEHKFKDFLQSRKWNDNQSKSFVDQALGDPALPDVKSWKELQEYLEDKEADHKAIEEAEYIFFDLYLADQ